MLHIIVHLLLAIPCNKYRLFAARIEGIRYFYPHRTCEKNESGRVEVDVFWSYSSTFYTQISSKFKFLLVNLYLLVHDRNKTLHREMVHMRSDGARLKGRKEKSVSKEASGIQVAYSNRR